MVCWSDEHCGFTAAHTDVAECGCRQRGTVIVLTRRGSAPYRFVLMCFVSFSLYAWQASCQCVVGRSCVLKLDCWQAHLSSQGSPSLHLLCWSWGGAHTGCATQHGVWSCFLCCCASVMSTYLGLGSVASVLVCLARVEAVWRQTNFEGALRCAQQACGMECQHMPQSCSAYLSLAATVACVARILRFAYSMRGVILWLACRLCMSLPCLVDWLCIQAYCRCSLCLLGVAVATLPGHTCVHLFCCVLWVCAASLATLLGRFVSLQWCLWCSCPSIAPKPSSCPQQAPQR